MKNTRTTRAALAVTTGLSLAVTSGAPAFASPETTSTEDKSLYSAVTDGVEALFDSIEDWLDARYGDDTPAPAPEPTASGVAPQGPSTPLPVESEDPGTVTDGTPPQDGHDGTDGQDGADGGAGGDGGDGGAGGDGPPRTAPSPTSTATTEPTEEPTEDATEPAVEPTDEPTDEASPDPTEPAAEPTDEPTGDPAEENGTSWQDDLRGTVDGWIVKWTDREDGPGAEQPEDEATADPTGTATPSPTETATEAPTDEATEGTTGGTGGVTGEQLDIEFSNGDLTSTYHVIVPEGDDPKGLIFWGDGSGANGYLNPESDYLIGGEEGLAAVAAERNMILVVPLAPGGEDNNWYDDQRDAKAQWASDLMTEIKSQYDVDENRIVVGGYSSGAQLTAWTFGPNHAEEQGVDLLLPMAWGTPGDLSGISEEYAAATTIVFNTGTNDTDGGQYNAYDAAQEGRSAYEAAGFNVEWEENDSTHDRGGEFGPFVAQNIDQHLGS